jgi:hypothetical protein
LISPKSDASGLSTSTAVDINSELEYQKLSTKSHIKETLAAAIGLDEAISTPQAAFNNGDYAAYSHGCHSMSHVSSLGF